MKYMIVYKISCRISDSNDMIRLVDLFCSKNRLIPGAEEISFFQDDNNENIIFISEIWSDKNSYEGSFPYMDLVILGEIKSLLTEKLSRNSGYII